MSAPPRLFDRDLLRTRLDRAAPGYAAADFLKARAAEDAVVRLEAIMRDFPRAVDLGARNGWFARCLSQSDAAARVGFLVETDLSPKMLAGRDGLRLVADASLMPGELRVATPTQRLVMSLPAAIAAAEAELRK